MAYIINDNGNGGYSRADFVSALEGLQPLLVSGQNVKTVNGSSVLGSGNLEVGVTPPTPQEYPQEALLTDTEKQYRANTLARINELNPIVNGKRKYMMFGFISDLHTMPKEQGSTVRPNEEYYLDSVQDIRKDVEEMMEAGIEFMDESCVDAESTAQYIYNSWPSDDYANADNPHGYYGLCAEKDIRLLGAIAYAAGFDAVLCGGDMSSGRMPYDCYSYQLYQIKKFFDKYVTVPKYFTDGNHDRKYDDNVIRRTNAEWLKWLNLMNSNGANYISANDARYGDAGNVYYVDFPKYKIRVIGLSSYEGTYNFNTGYSLAPFGYNFFDALSFENPQDAKDWTVLAFSHYNPNTDLEVLLSYYYSGLRIGKPAGDPWGGSTRNVAGFMNPDKSVMNPHYESRCDGVSKNAQYGTGSGGSDDRGIPGKAVIGLLSGHVHSLAGFSITESNDKKLLNQLSIMSSEDSSYTFSIFIVDDDNFKLHWLVFGPAYRSNKVPSGFDPTAKEFTLDYRHH